MALNASQDEEATAHYLKYLVLAHEVAHVRNRDLWILPLAGGLRGSLGVGLACFIAGTSLGLALSPALAFELQHLVIPLALGGVAVMLTADAALTSRERMADAVAALSIPPDALRMLTTPLSAGRTSPLEALVLQFRPGSWARQAYLGFDVPRPSLLGSIGTRLREVFNAYPFQGGTAAHLLKRRRDLRSKHLALPTRFTPTWRNVVWAGVFGTGLLMALHLIQVQTFLSILKFQQISAGASVDSGFLKAVEVWQQEMRSGGWLADVWRTLAILIGVAMSALILLPVRAAPRGLRQFSPALCRTTLFGIVTALLIFSIFNLVADGLINPGFQEFDGLMISGGWVWLGALLGQFMLLASLYVFEGADSGVEPGLWWKAIAGIGSIGACIALGLGMNDEVSAFTWLVWALILLMGIALLHHQGWNRWLAGSQYIFEEGQACAWIFGRACWLPGKPCHWWHTEGLHNILIYVGVMLFNFFFLPLLGMILLVPVLAAINARYAIVAGRPSDGIVNVASLAGVLLLALILAVPMFLIAYRSLRSQERPWRRIRRCKALTGMEELLDLPRLADSLRSEVTQILAEHVDPDRPYLISREGLPLLHATAMGFRVVGMPTLDQCRVDRFAEWVISGAHPKGGFGPQPGKTPDPHHTLSACQILAGRLTETERRIHRKWVRRQILLYTIHHRDWPASERWFYDVACLCDALVRLQTDSMSLQRIRAVVIPGVQHMWSRSGQTTRQARDLCTTLQLLSSEHSSIRQDLSRRWLPLHVASLPTLNPEQRLEQIEDVLIVLRWVDGRGLRERDEVCIVRDNLARTVSAALMNP